MNDLQALYHLMTERNDEMLHFFLIFIGAIVISEGRGLNSLCFVVIVLMACDIKMGNLLVLFCHDVLHLIESFT